MLWTKKSWRRRMMWKRKRWTRLFERRYEEGYDIHDPCYNLWLQWHTDGTLSPVSSSTKEHTLAMQRADSFWPFSDDDPLDFCKLYSVYVCIWHVNFSYLLLPQLMVTENLVKMENHGKVHVHVHVHVVRLPYYCITVYYVVPAVSSILSLVHCIFHSVKGVCICLFHHHS